LVRKEKAPMPTTTNDEKPQEKKRWNDDVLNREQLADFLTKSLTGETKILAKTKNIGLTVALDADWGSGKSFFIRHWANDLRVAGHPVVVFDAWENDIGDEAAVALMSSIKEELEIWATKLPKNKLLRRKAEQSTKDAIKGLRRAIIPASKVIAAGLLKKATGIAVDEIFDAFMDEDSTDVVKKSSEATSSVLESGLDEIFKRSLEDHQKRSIAISNFKTSISSLLDLLEVEASANIPMFVFADEVDRCRPSYAIKLLEEIKHIFGAPKICFVVSTNLDQLRESVCAIYGAGFDGHRYLKRFFDRHYTLPDPNYDDFSAFLLSEESSLTSHQSIQGLPPTLEKDGVKRSMSVISTAFALDLRSQKQVISVANAAVAAMPIEMAFFALWLLFLCALRHKNPQQFERLLSRQLDHNAFIEICNQSLVDDVKFDYSTPRDAHDRTSSIKQTSLSKIVWQYYSWSFDDLRDLQNIHYNTNHYDYPATNIAAMASEMPNSYNPEIRYKPSTASYGKLVKYAGLTQNDTNPGSESTI
jgi:hypothetical protein